MRYVRWLKRLVRYETRKAQERFQGVRRGVTDDERRTLGERLRQERLRAGKRQIDVAEETGIGQTSLSMWETGSRFPSSPELLRLSEYYGIPLDEMYGGAAREDQERLRPLGLTRVPVVGKAKGGRSGAEAVDVFAVDFPPDSPWDVDGSERGYEDYDISEHMIDRRQAGRLVVGCRVTGDSMGPWFLAGDLLLVERLQDRRELEDGDVVVVDVSGEGKYALKRFRLIDGLSRPLLESLNGVIPAMVAPGSAKLFGLVVNMYRSRRLWEGIWKGKEVP